MKPSLIAALIGSTALVSTAAAQTTNQDQSAATAEQPAAQASSGQTQPAVTVSSLRGQQLYNQSGKQFGRITNVMRGNNDQTYVLATAGDRQLLIPTDRIASEHNRYIVQSNEDQPGFVTAYREGMAGYQPIDNSQRIHLAAAQGQNTQSDGSRILVQQTAPDVRVERAAPQVSVQQPQPHVTVHQPTPEITVRQPAPTVTVDIPQPEIIVRMPRPDVDVAMARPQVEVRQPQPRVQVTQPQEQPQVQVQQAQPQVSVQQPDQRAQVNVQREGQPKVNYERADPRVTVNQAKGQPQVRFEQIERSGGQQQNNQQARLQQGSQQQPARQSGQQQSSNQQDSRSPERQAAYQQRFGGGPETTAATGSAPAPRSMRVNELEAMDVYNGRGEKLGEVDQVIRSSTDNKPYLVLAHGGFLGIGDDQVAFPLKRFAVGNDNRLVIHGVTKQDIERMDNWRTQVSNSNYLDDTQQVSVSVVR